MPSVLWLDCETYSEVPIQSGTFRYAEGAQLLLLAFALDREPVEVWDAASGEALPAKLAMALADPSTRLVAHNAQFDRQILLRVFSPERLAPLARWRCTMARALAHSLPASLGALCDFYGVPHSKDAGKPLIQLFSKPRPSHCKLRRADASTHPAQWQAFKDYCAMDVQAMRRVARQMPLTNFKGEELTLWRLDQHINARGVAIDLTLVKGAVNAIAAEQQRLDARCLELSGVPSTRRVAALRAFLAQNGLDLPDLAAATVQSALARADLPPVVRELLHIRKQASQSSTAKYQALQKSVSSDGRLRGTLQFCGASRTGRWAGRLFQPQNLRREDLPRETIDAGIEAFKAGTAATHCQDLMQSAGNALRGTLIAPAGRQLIVADLANIEGRVLAWLAGEQWKLEAFRAFDKGEGHDLYKIAYAKAFGIAQDDVSKAQRQLGKVMELMLGYGGGVGAFITGAKGAGIDPEDLAHSAAPHLPQWAADAAQKFLAWQKGNGGTHGLSDSAFCTCDALKRLWRKQHPKTVAFWNELEQAAKGNSSHAGKITVSHAQSHTGNNASATDTSATRLHLPSGRALFYWGLRDVQGRLRYQGTDAVTRRWVTQDTYAGKLAENVTQAVARDVLAAAMPRVERAGYRIVLTVHDELITEAPDTPDYSSDALCALLSTPPPWAKDLPLAASGFAAKRYRKD